MTGSRNFCQAICLPSYHLMGSCLRIGLRVYVSLVWGCIATQHVAMCSWTSSHASSPGPSCLDSMPPWLQYATSQTTDLITFGESWNSLSLALTQWSVFRRLSDWTPMTSSTSPRCTCCIFVYRQRCTSITRTMYGAALSYGKFSTPTTQTPLPLSAVARQFLS